MQSNHSKRNRASWGVFAALGAVLAAAAPRPRRSTSGNDGSDPTAGLIANNYGTLYGTTRWEPCS
jgi:hypothetical protein